MHHARTTGRLSSTYVRRRMGDGHCRRKFQDAHGAEVQRHVGGDPGLLDRGTSTELIYLYNISYIYIYIFLASRCRGPNVGGNTMDDPFVTYD